MQSSVEGALAEAFQAAWAEDASVEQVCPAEQFVGAQPLVAAASWDGAVSLVVGEQH